MLSLLSVHSIALTGATHTWIDHFPMQHNHKRTPIRSCRHCIISKTSLQPGMRLYKFRPSLSSPASTTLLPRQSSGSYLNFDLNWEFAEFLGELCSGAATNFDDQAFNPGIKCDCNFPNNTCHITRLRFVGNSFEGSIPPTFSRLTKLQELRISGLSNGTLDFIRDMKSLSTIVLRNNRLSGSIPTDIGEYQSLTRLFLCAHAPVHNHVYILQTNIEIYDDECQIFYRTVGINALSGEIPPELRNLTDLRSIGFGTNNFSGSLPYELGIYED
ncbi:hypothetical protein OSB04_023718 [Centaurea solstitialis]|uniref:Uncharacterized protein n=1 Tax=Centaurea solstitialis TaxID=347529 RepID=A0AA38WD75_9ASTR|nr:hypothetical protein OSB04_023718 [Centaurea solstitialis]